jgi:hypothetical protein
VGVFNGGGGPEELLVFWTLRKKAFVILAILAILAVMSLAGYVYLTNSDDPFDEH